MKKLSLETVCEGAAAERFNLELEKVLENILDPNTDPIANRTITLKLTLKPDVDRDSFKSKLEVKSTLAPLAPVTALGMIGKDIKGKPEAHEYPRPKQAELFAGTEGKDGNVTPMRKEK